MKSLILSPVWVLPALMACGADPGTSIPVAARADCSRALIANNTVILNVNNQHISANVRGDCGYDVPECNEVGHWAPKGSNWWSSPFGEAIFYPESTDCGSLEPVTCQYAIIGSQIVVSCQR